MLLSCCPVLCPCSCSCSACQRPAAAAQPSSCRLAALIYSTAAAPPPSPAPELRPGHKPKRGIPE
jgi:hypothetical protein